MTASYSSQFKLMLAALGLGATLAVGSPLAGIGLDRGVPAPLVVEKEDAPPPPRTLALTDPVAEPRPAPGIRPAPALDRGPEHEEEIAPQERVGADLGVPPAIGRSPRSAFAIVDPEEDSVAVAMPMPAIQVDGNLDEWPIRRRRYGLNKLFGVNPYGTGGLDESDLATGPDFGASFSLGYNQATQLLYLAVEVRDDSLIVGNTSYLDTDAIEVYIDGLRSNRSVRMPSGNPFWEHHSVADLPVQQYIGIPGRGRVYGTRYATNPVLLAGDLNLTKTRMAYRRSGDVTTYEWAIQPFDRYPDRPSKLEPGKRLGFELALADKDVAATSKEALHEPADARVAWINWGPRFVGGMKVLDAGTLGEVILAKDPE